MEDARQAHLERPFTLQVHGPLDERREDGMYRLFSTDDPSAIVIAREMAPGVTIGELMRAMGEPDREETGNGRLYLLYKNPPLASSYHTVAEVDPLNGLVLALEWGKGPDERWSLDPWAERIAVPNGDGPDGGASNEF
jgi:hypothetical protein